jgi:hypothetical protein
MSALPHEVTQEEIDEITRLCVEGARKDAAACEAKWRAQNRVFAWVEPDPTWTPCDLAWFEFDPPRPCRRIFRLRLAGGGQIRVSEKFVWWLETDGSIHQNGLPVDHRRPDGSVFRSMPTICYEDPQLAIVPHIEDGIVRARGTLLHVGSETQRFAVVLTSYREQAQEFADRAAATFRALNSGQDNFLALLDGSTGCAICGRALRDEVSKLLNIGPDCTRRIGRPHTLEAASAVVRRRNELLKTLTLW